MAKQGLERVLIRNQFYWESYHRVCMSILLMLTIIIGLLGFVYYKSKTPPLPKYFPTTPDGKPIQLVPFNEPLQTSDFVLDWAVKSVLSLYSFDYVTYRKVLQDAQTFFTVKGHFDFMLALKASNNLEAVKAKKQVISSEVIGKPLLTREGQLAENAPYSWDIQIPLAITYQNSENEVIKQQGIVLMRVDRGFTLRYQYGIAIAQLVFQVQG